MQQAPNSFGDDFSDFFMTLKLETETLPAVSPPPVVPTVVGFEAPQEKEKISKAPVGIPEAVASPTTSEPSPSCM